MNNEADRLIDAFLASGQTVVSNLVLRNYRRIGMTTAQLMVYLQLKSYLDQGVVTPNISQVATNLDTDTNQVYEIMHQMIQQKLMTHETKTDGQGKQIDYYDFAVLTKKLLHFVQQDHTKQQQENGEGEREQTFDQIEVEFGRPLSPIELETISKWIDEDHYSAQLISLALQEAVLNQAWNLKYMDRILRSWEKQHITTPQQVDKLHQERLDQHSATETVSAKQPNGPDIPLFKISDD